MNFLRKIVIFHTKYLKNFRASLRNWKKYDLSAKYLPPFFQLIPSHIKLNACSFTDENFPDFSEITQIKMYLSSINHEDE